jgi:hypothetical protein
MPLNVTTGPGGGCGPARSRFDQVHRFIRVRIGFTLFGGASAPSGEDPGTDPFREMVGQRVTGHASLRA